MATSSIIREFTISGEEHVAAFIKAYEDALKENVPIPKISAEQISNPKKLKTLFHGTKAE